MAGSSRASPSRSHGWARATWRRRSPARRWSTATPAGPPRPRARRRASGERPRAGVPPDRLIAVARTSRPATRYASRVDAGFVELVTEDRAAAEARLRESPSLAAETPWHALVCGDAAGIEQALADGTLDVRTAAGPLTAVPLVYVCFSRFAQRGSPRAPALIAMPSVCWPSAPTPTPPSRRRSIPATPSPASTGRPDTTTTRRSGAC